MKNDYRELMKTSPEVIEKVLNLAKELGNGKMPFDGMPVWWDGRQLDEIAFCDWFTDRHELLYVGSQFYDIDGFLSEEKLSREILEAISPYIKSNLSNRIKKLVDVLKLRTMTDELPMKEDRVHFRNGTYLLKCGFIPEKEFCSNRLPVDYVKEAGEPKRWLDFICQLLYEDDIPTLQEFMGYCMIPSARAQAMLMLIGKGGEGKSRVGLVMKNLFGDNMNICSVSKLTNNKFCPADQEGKLLMVDDDMQMEALHDTNVLKAIITMEDKMDLERKGRQSYQGYLYVRIMAFSNGTLSSLYDRSDGFYRRQIILNVREKDPGRVDDRLLMEKLESEKESIALWAIEGLKRLVGNGFHFTISDRARKNLEESKKEDDNIIDFFDSEGYIHFQDDAEIATKDLYEVYSEWCEDNGEKPRAMSSFSKFLKTHADKYRLKYDKNIQFRNGKKVRGYRGVCKHPGPCPFERDS